MIKNDVILQKIHDPNYTGDFFGVTVRKGNMHNSEFADGLQQNMVTKTNIVTFS